MKIVIDISEEHYALCKEKAKTNIGTCTTIAKGIPLEKVFEDIKAEIIQNRNRDISGNGNIEEWLEGYRIAFNEALAIIDKHISGKEQDV